MARSVYDSIFGIDLEDVDTEALSSGSSRGLLQDLRRSVSVHMAIESDRPFTHLGRVLLKTLLKQCKVSSSEWKGAYAAATKTELRMTTAVMLTKSSKAAEESPPLSDWRFLWFSIRVVSRISCPEV